jgi:predicted DNA-binding protein (MmcQ/YjbR family)
MPRKKPIERAREICLALPEATERLTHGEPGWFVGKKLFATWENHHHGDPMVGLWVNAAPGLQEILVSAQPDCFYRPKYVGHRGWIGVNMEGPLDWDQVADLVRDSYRMVALKRLAALVQG